MGLALWFSWPAGWHPRVAVERVPDSPDLIAQAKLAILVASLSAGVMGFLLLQFASWRSKVEAG